MNVHRFIAVSALDFLLTCNDQDYQGGYYAKYSMYLEGLRRAGGQERLIPLCFLRYVAFLERMLAANPDPRRVDLEIERLRTYISRATWLDGGDYLSGWVNAADREALGGFTPDDLTPAARVVE